MTRARRGSLRWIRALAGILLAAAAASGFGPPGPDSPPGPNLEACLPFDTPIFLSWRRCTAVSQAGEGGTPLKMSALFDEPEVQRFLEATLGDQWRRWRELGDADREFFVQGGALGMRLSTPSARSTVPELAMAFYVPRRAKEFEGFFLDLMRRASGPLDRGAGTGKPPSIGKRHLSLPGGPRGKLETWEADVLTLDLMGHPLEYLVTDVDSTVFVSTSETFLVTILRNCRGGQVKPLAENPLFLRVSRRLRRPGDVGFGFLGFETILRGLHGASEPSWKIVRSLGLDALRAIGAGVSIEPGGVLRERYFLDVPGEARGLLGMLALPAGPVRSARYVPRDAMVFLALHADPADLFHALEEMLRLGSPSAGRALRAAVAALEERTGLDFEESLLGAVGPEFSIAAGLGRGGVPIPDALACVQLRDSPRFASMVDRLFRLMPTWRRREVRYRGRTIVFLDIPDATGGRSGLGSVLAKTLLAPNYCIDGDFLFLSPFPESVKDVLRRRDGDPGHAALIDRPEFVSARETYPREVGALAFVDLRRTFEWSYFNLTQALMRGSAPRGKGRGIDLSVVPSFDTVARHLSPMSGALSSDRQGILLDSRSPFGSGLMLALGASVLQVSSRTRVPPVPPEPREAKPLRFERARALGDRAYFLGHAKEAVRYYTAALAVQQGEGEGEIVKIRFSRGMAYHRLARYPEARRDFQESVRLGHHVREAEFFLARGFAREGREAEAIRALRAAIAADPSWKPLDELLRERDFDGIRAGVGFRALVRELARGN